MPSIDANDPVQEFAQQIPSVPSPYGEGKLSNFQHIKLSAYWFATNFLWGALLLIMLPGEIKRMNPEFRAQALGLLTGLTAIVALIVPLVAGALSDRCASKWGRRRPFMVVGLTINIFGLMGMAMGNRIATPVHGAGSVWSAMASSPGFLIFTLGYIVVQFGNNVTSAAYMGVIPDIVPNGQRGVASGYMALMSQLGSLFGAIGVGMLLDHQPDTVKYLMVGIVLVGVALVTILGMREMPLPYTPPKIQWKEYFASLWINPKEYPDFAWVWITRALVMLGFYAVVPFIAYYLVDVANVSEANVNAGATKVQALILITSTLSGFYGGKISDKIGRKRVVYIANTAISVLALTFIFCHNLTNVMLAGALFGLGYGAYISVDYALGTDVLPSRKDAGKEMAVWHIAMTLPQSIAAPLAGFLIEFPGKKVLPPLEVGGDPIIHYTLGGYAAVFILCSVCFGLGAFLLKNVKGVK